MTTSGDPPLPPEADQGSPAPAPAEIPAGPPPSVRLKPVLYRGDGFWVTELAWVH